MQVVVITDSAEMTGGATRVALESARALAEAGVSVTYIHAVGNTSHGILDHPLIKTLGLGFSDVWNLPAAKGLQNGLWNAAAAKRVESILAAQPLGKTVIHLHQWTRAFSPSILSALANASHPVAITLHDYFIACPNGVYYRFDKEQPCDLTPMSMACGTARCDPRNYAVKLIRLVRAALTNLALKHASIDLIHVSDRAQMTIAPLLPFNARHHRVDNPVNINRRPPAEISPETKIAFVGRLVSEKGVDLAAVAAKAAGVGILFIGDGPLENKVRKAYSDAECVGWKDPTEVDLLLRTRIRAIVAPSRWYETGPLTVYEAMAAGLPVIVSNRAGASEKVTHGKSGFVIEPNTEDLLEAFRAVSNTNRARIIGQAAYDQYWAKPLTLDAHAARLIEVYEQILSSYRLSDRPGDYNFDHETAQAVS